MKNIVLNKKILDGINGGLSCVENIISYIFDVNAFQHHYLFYESSIPLSKIFESYIKDKITYSYFNKVERIQNIAKKNRFIDISMYTDIKNTNENEYICLSVNPNFIRKKYNITLLREDHYILLSNFSNDNYNYLNDIPRDIGMFAANEFNEIFNGKIIGITLIRNIDKNFIEKALHLFLCNLNLENYVYQINDCEVLIYRDIIGTSKILRQRVYMFCSKYTNVDFMLPYLNKLEKYYAILEYMRLRNKIDIKKIKDIIDQIQIEDYQILKKIKQLF